MFCAVAVISIAIKPGLILPFVSSVLHKKKTLQQACAASNPALCSKSDPLLVVYSLLSAHAVAACCTFSCYACFLCEAEGLLIVDNQ